jgi:hypothetical protein
VYSSALEENLTRSTQGLIARLRYSDLLLLTATVIGASVALRALPRIPPQPTEEVIQPPATSHALPCALT